MQLLSTTYPQPYPYPYTIYFNTQLPPETDEAVNRALETDEAVNRALETEGAFNLALEANATVNLALETDPTVSQWEEIKKLVQIYFINFDNQDSKAVEFIRYSYFSNLKKYEGRVIASYGDIITYRGMCIGVSSLRSCQTPINAISQKINAFIETCLLQPTDDNQDKLEQLLDNRLILK